MAKKYLSFLCVIALIMSLLTSVNVTAKKMKKPVLTKKKVTMYVGDKKTIKIKNVKLNKIKKSNVSWKVKNKSIVKIKKTGKLGCTITAQKTGSTYVYARFKLKKSNKKIILKCRVKVKKRNVDENDKIETDNNTTQVVDDVTTQTVSTQEHVNGSTEDAITTQANEDSHTTSQDANITTQSTATYVTTTEAKATTQATEATTEEKATTQMNATTTEAKATTTEEKATTTEAEATTTEAKATTQATEATTTEAEATTQAPIVVKPELTLSQATVFDSANVSNVIYNADGSVTLNVGHLYWGGGMAFAFDDQGTIVDFNEYKQVIFDVEVHNEDCPVAINYNDETSTEYDNGVHLIAYDSFKVGRKTYTYELPGDVKAKAIRFNKNSNSGDPCITIHSITLVKEEKKELTSMKSLVDPIFGYTGSCINGSQIGNARVMKYVKEHYSSITMENEMKPDAVLGNGSTLLDVEDAKKDSLTYTIPDSYKESTVPKLNFEGVDRALKIAKEYGLKVRYHTLVWHSQTPEFFFRENYNPYDAYVSKEVMDARLEMYVRSVMNHVYTVDGGAYKDTIYVWDVANEYVHNDSDKNWSAVYGNREGFGGIGQHPTFLKLAFVIADEMLVKYDLQDSCALYYNDFNCYMDKDKILELANYVNSQDGINKTGKKILDGIGMQSHLGLTFPSVDYYMSAMQGFVDAGYDVQVTELDLGIGTDYTEASIGMKYNEQATYITELMSKIIVLQKKQKENGGPTVTSFTWWGLYDDVSWRGGYSSDGNSHPLLFDKGLYDTKPAYDAFMNSFK